MRSPWLRRGGGGGEVDGGVGGGGGIGGVPTIHTPPRAR